MLTSGLAISSFPLPPCPWTSHNPCMSVFCLSVGAPSVIASLSFTLLLFLFSSYHFGDHFLSRMCSLLLYYTHSPRLLTLPALSSAFPGCEVMYGPCQRQNQWDAGCFNLAWKPSGSRSSVSWKSDSGGLSLLFLLPSLCPPWLAALINT